MLRIKGISRDTKMEFLKYLIALVVIAIFGIIITRLQGDNPADAMSAIFDGAFGDITSIGNTIRWITPSILTGLAAVVAFKSGVMNLGIEGQIYFGAFAAALAGAYINLPPVIHAIVCVLVGGLFGMLFTVIPAILKLFFRINEMIVTLMMNYIAILLTEYFTYIVMGKSAGADSNALSTAPILDTAQLPIIIKGTNANVGIYIAVILMIIIFAVYKYTIAGYELKQVGYNLKFSKIGGINVIKTFVSIFLLSGFIAGICGSVEVLGSYGKFTSRFSNNLGWDGIMIAMIAKNSPIGVVIVSILWGVLKAGALQMERVTNSNRLVVVLIQALFVLFVTIDYDKIFALFKSKRKYLKEGGSR